MGKAIIGYYSYLYARYFASTLWERVCKEDPLSLETGTVIRKKLLQHGGAKDPTQLLNDLAGDGITRSYQNQGHGGGESHKCHRLYSLLVDHHRRLITTSNRLPPTTSEEGKIIYGTPSCAVLCSLLIGSNGRQNHVILGNLVDRFIGWALPLFRNINDGDGTVELAAEGLHEFLNVAEGLNAGDGTATKLSSRLCPTMGKSWRLFLQIKCLILFFHTNLCCLHVLRYSLQIISSDQV
ncbi:unnamed protein product [Lactuca saligna]|uniref:Peptidase M3A/M3B catalytic domain-containing protein n=1 Tax=Lactuca saligna TaxID=75948 RepID=A0AA35YJ45_LACSI|nr:unnamed protein product [Lactuca saligna]